MNDKIKINLGSGHWKLEDWVNVDIDRESQPDVCANLAGGLPFASGVASLMHTEDFIDQLELDQAAEFLRECHRILSPGGVLRVLTPDMQKLAHLYLNDPAQLKTMWKSFVGVPLSLDTAGEILNIGMSLPGTPSYMTKSHSRRSHRDVDLMPVESNTSRARCPN